MTESIGKWVAVTKLKPWKDNPRMNTAAIEEVAKSIKRFGFASPIVARKKDNMIIAGHTRYEAAKSLGLKTVPVRFMDIELDDAQLLALADNKIGEIADWDAGKLKTIIAGLQEHDLSGLGWSDDELAALLDDNMNYDDFFGETEDGDGAEIYNEEEIAIINQVQLFFDEGEYTKFVDLLEQVKAIAEKDTREEAILVALDEYINKE
jgi:hypothetical protein